MTTVTQWIEQAPQEVKARFEFFDGRWQEKPVRRKYTMRVPRARRKPPVRYTCPVCGLVKMVPPSEGSGRVYCSIRCRNTARGAVIAAGAEARFWAGVDRRGPDECWLWQRRLKEFGHGQTNWHGKHSTSAHRVAWELTHGPIPEGLWVLHRCDVPACCNPAHLFLGTHADNVRDMMAKRRHATQAAPELRRLVVWLFNLVVSR
jgi:hypothetical protein